MNVVICTQYCGEGATTAPISERCWSMGIPGFGFAVRRHLMGGIVTAGAVLMLVSAACAATLPVIPLASTQPVLASHKALYRVTLTSTRSGSDYQDVNGKMFLEFTDSCDAWTTNQKSLLRIATDEGGDQVSRSVFAAWENKAGTSYRFSSRQTDNGQTSEYSGSATRNRSGDGGKVIYDKPDRRSYSLPPHFLFQTAQQVKVLEYAQKGGHFLIGDMFDGSEGGGSARFSAVILKPVPDRAQRALPANPLLDSPRHRMRVAFYPPAGVDNDDADGQSAIDGSNEPEYEMTMTLHDNGVVSDYDYDYEDFSVHGQLEAIQALPQPHC